MIWTVPQRTAIDMTRRDVLVAAAAGSGKTATLTERVLAAICREDSPTDIRRMLIVTFTNKAAEELRIKIRKKLEEKLEEEPDNAFLRRQLTLLPSADISTIHAFYSGLLQRNFAALGIPPKCRIADEAEFIGICRSVMEDVIEAYYNGSVDGEYAVSSPDELFDTFEKTRPDEKLTETLSELYKKVSSFPEGVGFFKKSAVIASDAADDFSKSPYYRILADKFIRSFSEIKDRINTIIDTYEDDGLFSEKYLPALDECKAYIKKAIKVYSGDDYGGAYTFAKLGADLPDFKRVIGEYPFKAVSQNAKKSLKELCDKAKSCFSFNEKDTAYICRKTAELCGDIYKVLSYFDMKYSAEKLRRRMLDYTDLERLSYKLICGDDGKPTETARLISEKYDEIYVDEYQDVNGIQDAIFAAISKNNRFLVGDIKQSIYAFRGAEPEIFADYRRKFGAYRKDTPDPCVLFLSDNFRCGKPIVDFTDLVFGKLFGADSAKIPYSDDDALVFSKKAEIREDVKVKIAVATGDGRDETEADYIAKQIKTLIDTGTKDDGTKITPDDIAVLCRKKSTCEFMEKALEARGINTCNTAKTGFFDAPEVLLAVSVISAVDNPMQDIPLASAMRSPVFGFTLDDLAKIRANSKDTPLYTAVCEYAEREDGEKCRALISKLSYYRKKARSVPADKFIRLLYRDTAMTSLIYNNSDKGSRETRKADLRMLYELSRNFESSGFGGISAFVSYCRDMIEKGTEVSAAAPKSKGKITIQTVHASKGLEYPVCFVCGIDAKFKSDNTEALVINGKLGAGVKLKNGDGDIIKGPIYKAITEENADNGVREEMRMLYVALTRAKKYLYITGKSKNAPVFKGGATLNSIMNCKSWLDLLTLALDGKGDPCCEYEAVGVSGEERVSETDTEHKKDGTADPALVSKLCRAFSFEYPYKKLSSVPNKVAVSRLYPGMLDGDDDYAEIGEKEPLQMILPDYADDEKKADAASKGTATHLFMQFCDFDMAEKNAREEAKRLTELGFIKKEAAELIRYYELNAFFRSGLYKRMKDAKQNGRLFFREFRFNIGLDAEEFTDDEEMKKALSNETLLVQGVVDCFFEEEDGTVTVCDYKTDRVENSEEAAAEFADRHRTQLSYYKKAIERITKKKVGKCVLYSFSLGRTVEF